MMQFYFLSILANLAAGTALAAETISDRLPSLAPLRSFFQKPRVRTTIGYLVLVIGFMKLLIRSSSGDVPVVGDLLPALFGMGMGFVLLFDVYKTRTHLSVEAVQNLEKAVLTYRTPLGLAGLVIAVLHFLLPGALFL